MMITLRKATSFTTAMLATASLVFAAAPAQAADFTVVADKTQNLALEGQVVNLTLSNLPNATGVYLRLCASTAADAASTRPTACTSMADTAWVTTNPAALAQGAKALVGPVVLKVPSSFVSAATTIDCTKTACGIAVRRDHLGGATDLTLDRFIPVTFSAAVAKSSVATDGNKVSFTVLNQKGKKVTFIVGYKKYTRVAKSDNFVFSAKAPKDKKFSASAYVANKKIAGKSLTK